MLDLKMMGESIRARRKELQITQKQLSNVTGIAQGYISDIENGNAGNITLNKLIDISKAIEVDLARLLSFAENSEEFYITRRETEFLKKSRLLSKEQKAKLEGIIEGMLMSTETKADKKGA